MARVDVKVVLLGQSGVGKSCLIDRYVNSTFEIAAKNTIGAAFAAKKITVASGRTISVGVWDTAGAEQFESLTKMYYHGSKAAIVCFDAARASSFNKLQFWVHELRDNQPGCRVYIAQTKSDMLEPAPPSEQPVIKVTAEQEQSDSVPSDAHSMPTLQKGSSGVEQARAVPATAVQEYASTVGARVFVTSARKGFGIQELFQTIAEDLAAGLPAPRPSAPLQMSTSPAASAQSTLVRSSRPQAPIIDLSRPLLPGMEVPRAQTWTCC